MAGNRFAALWPLKARSQETYDVVPISSIINFDENGPKGQVFRYKPNAKQDQTRRGQLLFLAASKRDALQRFKDGPRIQYPSRKYLQTTASTDDEAQRSHSSKRQQKAHALGVKSAGVERNSLKILSQYQKRTDSQLQEAGITNTVNSSSAPQNHDFVRPSTSKDTWTDVEPISSPIVVTAMIHKAGDANASGSADNQKVGGVLPKGTALKTGQEKKSENSNVNDGIDVSKVMREVRKLHASCDALYAKAKQEREKCNEILLQIRQERKEVQEERRKIQEERRSMQDEIQKAQDEMCSLESALTISTNDCVKNLDDQRMKIISIMNQKITEFKGISAAATSSSALSTSGRSELTSNAVLMVNQKSVSLVENRTGNQNSLSNTVDIGSGVTVIDHYWSLAKNARSRGQWARYAIKSAFGEDAKLYRATTPRSNNQNLLVFPDPIVSILQQHYRSFLLSNPAILWAKKQVRRKRKAAPENENESDEDIENDQSQGKTQEETKRQLKTLIEGLPALMADKATELWRRCRSKPASKTPKKSSQSEPEGHINRAKVPNGNGLSQTDVEISDKAVNPKPRAHVENRLTPASSDDDNDNNDDHDDHQNPDSQVLILDGSESSSIANEDDENPDSPAPPVNLDDSRSTIISLPDTDEEPAMNGESRDSISEEEGEPNRSGSDTAMSSDLEPEQAESVSEKLIPNKMAKRCEPSRDLFETQTQETQESSDGSQWIKFSLSKLCPRNREDKVSLKQPSFSSQTSAGSKKKLKQLSSKPADTVEMLVGKPLASSTERICADTQDAPERDIFNPLAASTQL